MTDLLLPPADLLACPNCGATTEQGFESAALHCGRCQQGFYALAGLPCLFPNGLQQQALWQHQLGAMREQGKLGLAHLHESLSRYDLTETSRERLNAAFHANRDSLEQTLQLFADAGLEAQIQDQFGDLNASEMTEYYDLILRDWAWDQEPIAQFASNENDAALDRVMAVYADTGTPPEAMLVLGSGAGRLSWDLHNKLRPQSTLALDSNPLLALAAHTLVRRRQSLNLPELKVFPQIDKPTVAHWQMDPPDGTAERQQTWFGMAANAWAAPLKAGSFDLIVTPWFIDVNGGDLRDLIGLICRWLKPGGRWINTGPLLFLRSMPFPYKYQDSEIREFLALAGLQMEQEQVCVAPHLVSPMEARLHYEQVWSFSARLRHPQGQALADAEPPWLLLHHLPVPEQSFVTRQQHPLIDAILALVDGQRSIQEIALHIAPQLPEGIAPRDAVVTLLGQILAEMRDE